MRRKALGRPADFTVDGTATGELDQDRVDAFFAAAMGLTVEELCAGDTDGEAPSPTTP